MTMPEELKSDIELELKWAPGVHAEHIGVSVDKGVVGLSGSVESLYEKWAAERAALRVSGVKAIASEIKVDLPFAAARTDEAIAKTATDHLQWSSLIPQTVQVVVSEGWVTLTGLVPWQFQKTEAEAFARTLQGAKGVTNEISLEHRVIGTDVKALIEQALKRNALVDAGNITVEMAGSKVFLSGTVRSRLERDEAESAAFAAPGVMNVENSIAIQ